MKPLSLLLAVAVSAASSNAWSAYQLFPVPQRLSYKDVRSVGFSPRMQNTLFHVELIDDQGGVKAEEFRDGHPFVTAMPGENYSVRIYNPLPVRVAVNLTIDGLNSISGKPSGISDGRKWMIDPYDSVTINGWQVNDTEARRFFFTDKPKSYAKWLGKKRHENLAANCGVIGVAYFWNQQELDQYYQDHPVYRYHPRPMSYNCPTCSSGVGEESSLQGADRDRMDNRAPSLASPPTVPMKAEKQLAGTGMGERESNPTTQVEFQFNAGMYQLAQAVVIYYDFTRPTPTPNPFPGGDYAAEM
jgi:hypothetical protein